ncbi:MAG: restriction endonuclease [Chloroflexota bacterium]|nr:restriction endonuclease [Chloroflexota bacterium]
MSIPDFQSLMLPLLVFASDGKTHHIHEAVDYLSDEFKLTEEERAELLKSGQQPVFYNRVGWARTYLKKSGLLEDPERGFFRITDRGNQVLTENPTRIDMKYLRRFEEYLEFRERHQDSDNEDEVEPSTDLEELTPEEAFEETYQRIRSDLADELLEAVIESTPGFFEKLVIDLLVKIGYGGSQRSAARAVGRSGDEGIDGIIDEDRLGLEQIYIQAKKWDPKHPIGRPDVQKFVGALSGKRARKGVFITTSRFTKEAYDYAASIERKVVLIDGSRLTMLMIDHNVGVSVTTNYEMKEINTDYFGEST